MTETYDSIRTRHVGDWLPAMFDRVERLGWPAERIEQHRNKALRDLVARARESSPWHRERLAGIDIDALVAHDLSELPTMTKHDLQREWDGIVTDGRVDRELAEKHLAGLTGDSYLLDELHVVASGGSTGERTVFVYGWDAWIDVQLGLGRRLATLFGEPDIGAAPIAVGVVAAYNATHMTSAVSQTFSSDMLVTHSLPVTLPVSDIVNGLNDVQPVVLIAYASMLGVLAAEAQRGTLDIAPKRIVATSEPLLPEIRAAAETSLGGPVANCWGTSEAGVLAVGCWQSNGMHLNEDLAIVEPVDADNRPVPAGERAAKVLLTNLFNPTLPLIRYELGDEVTLVGDPCPCGSAHRRIADVQGRIDDILTYGDVEVHPHVIRSVMGRHPSVAEYQVVQTADGVDVRIRVDGRIDHGLLAEQLTTALAAAGVPDPKATTTLVDSLERHAATGKLRRFVPLRAASTR